MSTLPQDGRNSGSRHTQAPLPQKPAVTDRAALDHPYTSNHCARFACNLLKDMPHWFRFVTDPNVDSTNNPAERALRPMVVARKVSGGSRSEKGAGVRAILSSILQSLDQRGLDVFEHTPRALLTSDG